MKICITGAYGRLGKEMMKQFPEALKPTKAELNIADEKAVSAYIAKHKPDLLIHLGAYTGIRPCQDNKELAWNTNVLGTLYLIKACERLEKPCKIVYMGSPCIFSGEEGDYNENSMPDPKHYYGFTKTIAECMIRASSLKYLIVRGNFVATGKWLYPQAFTDRYSDYLFADELAARIKKAILKNKDGILHILGKRMSMYDLAKVYNPDIKPITMKEYVGPPLTKDMTLTSIYKE